MDRVQRVGNAIFGTLLAASGILLIFSPRLGLPIVALALGVALISYGIRKLVFFFTMARHMVGGMTLLFVGIIALDMGAFALTLIDDPRISIVLFLIGYNGFLALVNAVRAMERRKLEMSWKPSLVRAVVNLLLALACLVFIGWQDVLIVILCVSLFYLAATRLSDAFHRTDIIYIQ